MRVIWIIGKNGMLGSELYDFLLKNNSLQVFATSSAEIDITNYEQMLSFVKTITPSNKIDFIINCTAYTAVDKAEQDFDSAFAVNEYGIKNLVKIAKITDAALIHISTDYIFDGLSKVPYTENDVPNPLNVYGKSKLAGEKIISSSSLKRFFILRTSWLYGKKGKNFVKTIINALNNQNEIRVVSDQTGCPTSCTTLCKIISLLISKNEFNSISSGIYNVTDKGQTTRFDFAKKIYSLSKKMCLVKKECKIFECATKDYPAIAKRPPFSVLSTKKIEQALNIEFKEWSNELEKVIEQINPL